jgi:putative transposase
MVGRVVSRAVVIATGVTADGGREVLGLDVGDSEDGAFWMAFLRSLKARGLAGVQLVISDAHTGLKGAIAAVMAGASWQRCRVHFLRNILARVPKGSAEMVAAAIRTIFAQPTAAEVIEQVDKVAAMLAPKFPTVAAMLADAREDLTAFASFPVAHWTKLWSTDESFKARVALSAGWGGVSLVGGRGRPRSEEQGLGAGSPAAQLAP